MGIQYVQPVKVCSIKYSVLLQISTIGIPLFQVVPYGEPVAAVDAKGQFSVPVDSPHGSDR